MANTGTRQSGKLRPVYRPSVYQWQWSSVVLIAGKQYLQSLVLALRCGGHIHARIHCNSEWKRWACIALIAASGISQYNQPIRPIWLAVLSLCCLARAAVFANSPADVACCPCKLSSLSMSADVVCPVCATSELNLWVIITKLDTYILYGSHSACIDPDVKRSNSRSHGYESHHSRMAANRQCLLWPLFYCCRRGSARRMTVQVFGITSLFLREFIVSKNKGRLFIS